jgi:hypothetical protein
MQTKSFNRYLGGSILLTALFGALAGILLIALDTSLLLKIIFVIMGIVTVFYSLPGIAVGLMSISTGAGKVTLIFSVLSAVLGFLMIFQHESYLMFFLGGYLIIFPLIEILLAKDKLVRLKAELPKLILGVVMLVVGPAGALEVLFDVAGWIIIVLTAFYTLLSLLSLKKPKNQTGNRIFVDVDGNGTVDTVIYESEDK